MWKNYLKIAFRNLRRHKLYAFINVIGLTVALAGSLLIFLYVADEFNYDRFHEDADRIYRVLREDVDDGEPFQITYPPAQTAELFLSELPEVENATRLTKAHSPDVRYRDNALAHDRIIYADTNFFDVFSHSFIAGNPATALNDPYSVVITESSARKYFGDDPALGNSLIFDQRGRFDNQPVTVTGIIEDLPHNTSYPFEMVLSMRTIEASISVDYYDRVSSHAFVLLKENADLEAVRAKLPALSEKAFGEQHATAKEKGHYAGFRLQPLVDIHFNPDVRREYIPSGGSHAQYLYMLLSVAIFLIVIACINFMNLATARSTQRAKEIGIRKAVGSSRGALIRQHLTESVLYSTAASVLAVGAAEAALPVFRNITGKPLAFQYLDQWYVLPALFLLALIVGLLAGSYPAVYLTRPQPAAVLRGNLETGRQEVGIRRMLVLFQFAVSIALLICTGFVLQQLRYFQSKDLGLDTENVVVVDGVDRLGQQAQAFKEALLQQSQVRAAGFVSTYPSRVWGFSDMTFHGSRSEAEAAASAFESDDDDASGYGVNMNTFSADEGFVPALGIDMAAGRNFSTEGRRDSAAVLINRSAARKLGWSDARGKALYYQAAHRVTDDATGETSWESRMTRLEVVGIVEDYHYLSLHNEIEPVVIYPRPTAQTIAARVAPGDLSRTIETIERLWSEYAPYTPFSYSFLDDEFAATFQQEERFAQIIGFFTALIVVIACLGIFGLATFTTNRRTKEIGVRKVFGASAEGIAALLLKDFAKLVVVAFVLAAPVGYYVMHRWLQNFAYRIELDPWTFVGAGLLTLAVALATAGYQAIRAALANPVDSLRYE